MAEVLYIYINIIYLYSHVIYKYLIYKNKKWKIKYLSHMIKAWTKKNFLATILRLRLGMLGVFLG